MYWYLGVSATGDTKTYCDLMAATYGVDHLYKFDCSKHFRVQCYSIRRLPRLLSNGNGICDSDPGWQRLHRSVPDTCVRKSNHGAYSGVGIFGSHLSLHNWINCYFGPPVIILLNNRLRLWMEISWVRVVQRFSPACLALSCRVVVPRTSSPTSPSSPPPSPSKGLSGGAIAGIVLGVVIGTAVIIGVGFVAWRFMNERSSGRPV